MKSKLIFALLIWTTTITFGQRVPSSCDDPADLIADYKNDSYRITVKRLIRNSSSYKDSIEIPKNIIDTTLKALFAVYNANGLPAKDTVCFMFPIHSFENPDLNKISFYADSNLIWVINLRQNITPTGNSVIDSLINKYRLKLIYYYPYNIFSYHHLTLKSDSNYNMKALGDIFNGIQGVHSADYNLTNGDGGDIKDSVFSDHVELTYSYGWGDCPMGCMYKRYWKFNIFWDCSVEYVSSYGSILPVTGFTEIEKPMINIFPNPFEDYFYISNTNSIFDYKIINMLGQEVQSGNAISKIEGLISLRKGIYFIQVINDNKVWTQKILHE